MNKSSTRVTLRWNVVESEALGPTRRARLRVALGSRITRSGELIVHAQRYRSRARNRTLARERLAELMRESLRTRRSRVATRPTRTSRERRLETKRQRARVKSGRARVRGDEA